MWHTDKMVRDLEQPDQSSSIWNIKNDIFHIVVHVKSDKMFAKFSLCMIFDDSQKGPTSVVNYVYGCITWTTCNVHLFHTSHIYMSRHVISDF